MYLYLCIKYTYKLRVPKKKMQSLSAFFIFFNATGGLCNTKPGHGENPFILALKISK